jgi:hypothetical protein
MRIAAALLLAAASAAAAAQQVVTSPAPEAVAVTVYRDPERGQDDGMDADWLGGYALITETRTVDLPPGTSELRFEGVAGTIMPASVIIRGLPGMPDEKNYDARLLSAGSLVEAALGRQVHLRRTSRATGKVIEQEAIIRSGPDGIVLQTAAGFEALRCSGLSETLVYQQVPPGLSAKPTLSIQAGAPAPTRATLQLTYLAGQLDWQANYVSRLSEDGRTLDLFAWLTLANNNDESFPGAQVNAVAGKPNREEGTDERSGTYSPGISLSCWPAGRTSDPVYPAAPPPPPPPAAEMAYDSGEEIIVTGSLLRKENLQSSPVAIMAAQEELGDLKRYRIPEPVTVAANGQKQVALLHKSRVKVERLYSLRLPADRESDEWNPAELMLRTKNNKEKGLGLPLPSGQVAVFEEAGGQSLLAGQTSISDLAVDNDVELVFGESSDVQYFQRRLTPRRKDEDGRDRSRGARFEIELTNATREKAKVEVGLRLYDEWEIERSSSKLSLLKGRKTWVAEVPANGKARLTYTLARPKPRKVKQDEED